MPPWQHFHGNATAFDMMKFVEERAHTKFILPDLPHVSPGDEEEYYRERLREVEERQARHEEGLQKEVERNTEAIVVDGDDEVVK